MKMEEPKVSKKEQKLIRERMKAKAKLRQKAPRYVILMGLPASGKSTFSQRMQNEWRNEIDKMASTSYQRNKKTSDSFLIANQDKLGKRACVDLVSKHAKSHRIIIDRCNPLESDRYEWVQLLNNPPKSQIALIYFAGNVEDCIERAKERVGHETIPEGRGERIIRDIARRMETPTLNERQNQFGTVFEIESFDQCDDILRMWGC